MFDLSKYSVENVNELGEGISGTFNQCMCVKNDRNT